MGQEALTLSVEDLQLAREEVKEAIVDLLDPREYLDMGVDSWEIFKEWACPVFCIHVKSVFKSITIKYFSHFNRQI